MDAIEVGTRTGVIKLTMAACHGIQNWWHRFPPLSGY